MADLGQKTPSQREECSELRFGADALIAELARRGNGQLTRAALIAAGVSDNQIAVRVARGQLVRRRRGVYALGHCDETSAARVRSALLEIGPDSAASHLSAAGEWGIRGSPVVVDVTCSRRLPRRDGIRLHRLSLEPDEMRHRNGLALTTPARTLFDLGTMLGTRPHAKAANQAFVERLVTIAELRVTHARHRHRKGSVAFARLLALLDPEGREIASPLEARLNAFLRTRGFPPWESNAALRIAGETIRPAVLWRVQRVIVEADGRDPHLAPLTYDSDRRRDRRLRVEGFEPVRVTSAHLGAGGG